MNIIKKLVLPLLVLVTTCSIAQKQSIDSLKQKETFTIKEKFPESRFLNFEYGKSLNRDFTSELPEQDKNNGTIKNQQSFRAFINVPVYMSQKWKLISSGAYEFNQFEFENFSNPNIFEQNRIMDFHKFSTSLDAIYFSTLFNKPIIYNASITADGSNKDFGRVKGTLGFSFILKKTERSTLALGAIGFIDPSAPFPVLPVFTYNHKFKNSKWDLDLILPQRVLIRKFMGENGRLSFGSSLGNTAFYTTLNNSSYNDVFEYNQIELRTGLMYERRINDYLIGTIQGGLQNFIGNRLTEKGGANKDYIYKNKQDGTGYFQIGISIDPFAKKK